MVTPVCAACLVVAGLGPDIKLRPWRIEPGEEKAFCLFLSWAAHVACEVITRSLSGMARGFGVLGRRQHETTSRERLIALSLFKRRARWHRGDSISVLAGGWATVVFSDLFLDDGSDGWSCGKNRRTYNNARVRW